MIARAFLTMLVLASCGGGGPLGERFSEDLQDVIATGFGGGQRVGAQYGLKVHVS